MRTDNANKQRTLQAKERKEFCLNHRDHPCWLLALILGISKRSVRYYLSPGDSRKERTEFLKQYVYHNIDQGKTVKEIQNGINLVIPTSTIYYWIKNRH